MHKKNIRSFDIVVLTRQLATSLHAGIPLAQVFQILIESFSAHPSLKQLLRVIARDIQSGSTLAAALKKHPQYFNALYCGLVAAGEQSGALDILFLRLATYLEKMTSLKRKLLKALLYPSLILIVAGVVCSILLIFVVPQFETVFHNAGTDLPWFTKGVISVSHFLGQYVWFILFCLVGVSFVFYTAKKRSAWFSHRYDSQILKLPVTGKILHKVIAARFSRTLATLFVAGVPLIDALNKVATVSGNHVYEKGILNIRNHVATGNKIVQAMHRARLFPALMVQMVAIGEESGKLDDMLHRVAEMYEEEVDQLVDGLSQLLEPLLILVLGIFVGGLVIALYLPIFQLGGVF